jgi:hypothetical protein
MAKAFSLSDGYNARDIHFILGLMLDYYLFG